MLYNAQTYLCCGAFIMKMSKHDTYIVCVESIALRLNVNLIQIYFNMNFTALTKTFAFYFW